MYTTSNSPNEYAYRTTQRKKATTQNIHKALTQTSLAEINEHNQSSIFDDISKNHTFSNSMNLGSAKVTLPDNILPMDYPLVQCPA